MSSKEVSDLEEVITAHIDARLRKLMVAIWLMIFGGLSSLIYLGVQWGAITTQVENHLAADVHMRAADKYKEFVTRTEWQDGIRQRDVTLNEIKAALLRLEGKVDKL